MNFSKFTNLVESVKKPFILLEGSRNVSAEHSASLTNLAVKLTSKFSNAVFRSGGAKGSDELFMSGVSCIDSARIQVVLTKANRTPLDNPNIFYFDRLPEAEQAEIFYLTVEATPEYKSLIDFYKRKQIGKVYYKAQYLLRDALKVCGSKSFGMPRADVGCFYVNSDKKGGGGTGHTIRICRLLNVPVIEQTEWLKWL